MHANGGVDTLCRCAFIATFVRNFTHLESSNCKFLNIRINYNYFLVTVS